MRVDGAFDGEILTAGTLVVGPHARVVASIEAGSVVVEGHLRGEIRASDVIELRATARVVGTLRCPALALERGATFDGECRMGGDEQPEAEHGRSEPARDPEVNVERPGGPRA